MATLLNNSQQKALTTLARAKVFLGIGTTTKDDLLTQLINQATGFIERYTKRNLTSQTYTNLEMDGTGTQSLLLPHYPVRTFTILEVNQATDNTDDWTTIDAADYFVDTDSGLIRRVTKFTEAPNKYRATFVAGYLIDFASENDPALHTLPFELELACHILVSAAFNRGRSGGIERETIGDSTVVWQKEVFQNKEIKDILDKYVKPTI